MTNRILTQDELKAQLHYNPYTGIFTRIKCSSNTKVGDIAGWLCDGYVKISVNGNTYRAHRLAWLYVNGNFPKEDTDHINGIKNDNRITNLRAVTTTENVQNIKKARTDNKTSGLLGVCFCKSSNKWRAVIQANKQLIHIGYFNDKFEAHQAYLSKKRLLHSTCTI